MEGQRRQETGLRARLDNRFTVRLDCARGNLGHQLVGGDGPDRIESQVVADSPADAFGQIPRRAEEASRTGRIDEQVALVIGHFDQR